MDKSLEKQRLFLTAVTRHAYTYKKHVNTITPVAHEAERPVDEAAIQFPHLRSQLLAPHLCLEASVLLDAVLWVGQLSLLGTCVRLAWEIPAST